MVNHDMIRYFNGQTHSSDKLPTKTNSDTGDWDSPVYLLQIKTF